MDNQEALENARRYYSVMERHGASIVTGEYRDPLLEGDDEEEEDEEEEEEDEDEDEDEESGEDDGDSQEESLWASGDPLFEAEECDCPQGERCMCDEDLDEDLLDERRQRRRQQKKGNKIQTVVTKRTKALAKAKSRRRYRRRRRKIKRSRKRKEKRGTYRRDRSRVAKRGRARGTRRSMSDKFMDAVEAYPKLFKAKEEVERVADEVLAAEGVFYDIDEFDEFVESMMFELQEAGLLHEAAELPGVRFGGTTSIADTTGPVGPERDMTSPRSTVVFGKPLMPYLDNLGYAAEAAAKLSEMAPTEEESNKLREFAEFCESYLDQVEMSGRVDEERLKAMCLEASSIVATAFREFRDQGALGESLGVTEADAGDNYNLSLSKVERLLKKYGGEKVRSLGKPDSWRVPGARSGVLVWHSNWKDGHAERVEISGVASVYPWERSPLRDLEKELKKLQ